MLIEGTPFDLSTVEAIGELRQDGYSVPRGYYLRFIDDLPITGEEFCYTEALRLPDDIDYDDYLELYARWLGVKDGVTFKEDPDASVRHYLKLAEQALAESRKDLQEETQSHGEIRDPVRLLSDKMDINALQAVEPQRLQPPMQQEMARPPCPTGG